ncbi:MAG: hypothetical protein AAB133_01410 [Pseudomonadota bacterium]
MEFLRGAAKAGLRSRPSDGNEAEQAQDADDLAGLESEATAGLAEEVAKRSMPAGEEVGDVDDGLRGIAWDRDGRPLGDGRGEALLVELDPVVEGVEWYVDGAGQVLARAVGGPAVDEPEDEAAEDGGVGAVAGLAHGDCAGMSEAAAQCFVGEDEIVVTRFALGDEGTGRPSARGLGQGFESGDDSRDEIVDVGAADPVHARHLGDGHGRLDLEEARDLLAESEDGDEECVVVFERDG